MALHIHHGPHLAPLTDSLVSVLAAPLADVFASEVIAIPTAGVRDWLQQRLALSLGATGRGDGVSANIQMAFPGQFIRAALGQRLIDDDPWDIDHLTWAVLTALETTPGEAPGYASADAGGPPARGRLATARRIADLFDRYANNRPQILQHWQLGLDGDGTLDENAAVVPLPPDQLWQPELWRRVRALIDTPTQAELLPSLLDDLRHGRLEPQLPERVALFGVSAIAPSQLNVLDALAAVRDVHVYLVHPSTAAWHTCRQQLGGRLVARSNCDATAAVLNPLVRSWTRSSMEAAALIKGVPAQFTLHEPAARSGSSLLAKLQADITNDLRGDASLELRHDDTSVQVHACHGTTRQLEVLRDALGHLFAADPTLAAHEVVVVCPDLARFAPLVGSVFQRGSFPVPVQVSDLSLGAENPVVSALAALLASVAGRCTASDLLGLCALAPVQKALGITVDDITLIDQWVTDLGTSWGLDADQRGEWIPAEITDGTWSSTLDRLLLGAAMPAPNPRVGPCHIAPFDDIDAQSMRTAGVLSELVARLRIARSTTSGQHTVNDWVDIITVVVGSLCATDPDDAWQLAQVLETIADLRAQSSVNGEASAVLLALSDIRALLKSVLGAQRGRLSLRSGAVTVTAMVPVRNLAARAICVLGLDESSLRSGGGDGDDVLSTHPCVGERDPRVEGRHLLLDALMSAGEHFIITFDGSDITTNRPVPPPVQLAELFDVVATTVQPAHHVDSEGVEKPDSPVLHRHPRQAYDERNFVAEPTPFSFDDDMRVAALARRAAANTPRQFPVLSPVVPATVTLGELASACSHPARTYLNDRVDARLPARVEDIDNDIPLAVSSLATWRLGSDLLAQHRTESGLDQLDHWRAAQQLAGDLPPRALADAVLDEVQREVDLVLDSVSDLRGFIMHTVSEPVDLTLVCAAAPGSEIRLVDTVHDIADHTLIRVEFKRPAPRYEIAAALDLAAVVVADPTRPWQALVITRGDSGGKPKPIVLIPTTSADRVEAARHLLSTALSIRLQALREPLPLFEHFSHSLYTTATVEDTAFATDLNDEATSFLWGQFSVDDIVAPNGDGRAESLANDLWGAFYAFFPAADLAADIDGDADADATSDNGGSPE